MKCARLRMKRWRRSSSLGENPKCRPQIREFMGVSPREYAATPHPILGPIMQERSRVYGVAVQTLDRPDRSDPKAA